MFRVNNALAAEQRKGIIYIQLIDYNQILDELQKFDTVLEVVQPGQVGVTLRYYEAITYNKKLITNNEMVKKLPFYNPDYMFVFCDPEDIDLEWVKRSIKDDYHYNNEFSPKELVKDIIRETQREK